MTNREKIDRLKELIALKAKRDLFGRLEQFDDKTNPNYKMLYSGLKAQRFGLNEKGEIDLLEGPSGILLEGSSRSAKTWSSIDFIIYLGTVVHKDDGCTINVYREVYNDFKTTLYDDFKRRLDDYDLPNPFHNAKEVKSFKIGGAKVMFIGCDKVSKAHGAGAEYSFFNEIMHIPRDSFDQITMRTRVFWWADFNPSFSDHWVFDNVQPNPTVWHLRTTFLDNAYISANERNKILGYEPWELGSYEVTDDGVLYGGEVIDENNQPPPHPTNIENGTADEFMWVCYGLGLRGAMKGVIFNHVRYIDQFPDIAYTFGLDFGFTVDPSAVVKYAQDGNDIYLELMVYSPTETADLLSVLMETVGVDMGDVITADSADRYTTEHRGAVRMVQELNELGWVNLSKVSKKKNIMYWLTKMRQCRIHVVKNHLWKHVKKERENYKFKEVNGIQINQPEDKYNHFWDASRYGYMAYNQEDNYIG